MKDKYEISLWEDYLVPASATVPAHYEERKLGVIGSDSITAPCRAFEPRLVENTNGTHTLTFKMYYTFKENNLEDMIHQFTTASDQDLKDSNSYYLVWKELVFNGESYQNPFLSLLVNERKVKAFWKGKWYDLVIKNCQEDSSGKSITYTCTDLYINELSKTGFDIVLDAELGNNSGTAIKLAETVLKGTDWTLDADGSDTVRQEKEEPVYEVDTTCSWSVTNETIGSPATIDSESKILVFYNKIQDFLDSGTVQKNMYTQFAYAETYECDTNTQRVINAHCYSTTVTWLKTQHDGVDCIQFGTDDTIYGYVYYSRGVSNNYRASRLVKSQLNKFDPLTGKYCNVWKATEDGEEDYAGAISENDFIYGYKTTEWNDALVVNNLVINSKDFITTEGWLGDSNLVFQLYPPYTSSTDISDYSAKSYLKLTGDVDGVDFYNAGIRQSSSYLPNGFSIGETFIFRYKARANNENESEPADNYISSGIEPTICTYTDSDEQKIIDTSKPVYFDVETLGSQDGWNEFRLTCKKSATRTHFYDEKIGLFLQVTTTCWLEEVQLFQEIYGVGTQRINPGDIDVQSVSTIKYVYYNHTKSAGLLSADDVMPLWSSKDDWNYDGMDALYNEYDEMDALYNEKFEKIRSINAKQSNRFNLLQTIAETFECWVQFQINHDSTGRTIYNDDGTPQKYVRFKQEIGQQTGIGFVYGIDLKTISRTIQSDQIVTKTIVSANNNQFATNGFCTISRSEENYPRTTFLLNFDYYISQGLIDGGILNNDLYDSTGEFGYFYWLNKYNTEYDSLTDEIAAKQTELTKQLSYQTVYEGTITSLQESIQNIRAELMNMADVTTWSAAITYIAANATTVAVSSRMNAIQTQQASLISYSKMKEKLDDSVVALQDLITDHTKRQKDLLTLIKDLDLRFYKKYSRFIQEGSWVNENYIDDNLYYLDAQSVAYTSSRPQISYNISVLRISGIEGFENKVFHLGDIAFIQDTEFFGYTYIDGVKTPYKEKVLVSEITSYFDEPEKDTFKIQNYKTQFEDLFQRITSTTQALQYASGEYARAAATVETNGTINPETLQNSIALNEQLVYSAQNEAIVTDSTGLTVTDTTNPNKKTKLTSGGIFITTDGGATWKNAVRGEGIATQYLTTGSINTSSINIMDGSFKAFRWDESGINAYYQLPNDGGINLSKFVRFDHYGVYGINNNSESLYAPESEAQVWEDALFGLTWEGLFIKNKYDDHLVEVSSRNDIQIVDTRYTEPLVRLKIGLLDKGESGSEDIYGLRLADSAGEVVLENRENGKLWLRNALNISSSDESIYNIAIGYLDTVEDGIEVVDINGDTINLDAREIGEEEASDYYHRTLDINKRFVVWEDGTVFAEDGYFTGTINAKAGQVGVLKVLEDGTVVIETEYIEVTEAGEVKTGVFEAVRLDGEGITISNGGIEIRDRDDKPLLQFNDDGTGLVITGDGSFTGEINATSGRFEGSVFADYLEASSGEIGGWILKEEGLYSRATRNEEDDWSLENSSVVLDGENGYIKANRIYLGVGAQIENYLQLGEAYLFNPEKNDGELLKAGAIRLWEDGKMKIGEIEVDGKSSTIKGTNFLIHPDYSEFSNVNVSGKISTCVFETNHVQAVGGSMIFKPSYKIIEYTSDKIVLDKKYEGRVGNFVYIVQEGGELLDDLVQVARIEENKIFLSSPIKLTKGLASLVDIGYSKDLIIGINSNDGATGHLLPRGMTVSEFDVKGRQVKVKGSGQNVVSVLLEDGKTRISCEGRVKEGTTPKVFLGDLGKSGISYGGASLEGFGLFSDNVYLTGSLATQIRPEGDKDGSYAGINTLSGAEANKFESLNDNSKIVFWAGAKSSDQEDVQNALFQVTEKGSLYAQQGIFKGAIITDSHIESADIYTARIHGFFEGESSNLDFYNAEKGISFWRAEYEGRSLVKDSSQKIFTIGMEGLYTEGAEEDKYFIKISDSGVAFEGVSSTMLEYRTKTEEGVHLLLKENRLAWIGSGREMGNLSFAPSKVSLEVGKEGESVVIEKGEIGIMENTKMHRNILYSEMMEYKKTLNGYDLYVTYEGR